MHVATTPRNFVKAYHDVLSDLRFNLNDKLVYLTLLSYQEAGVQVFPSNAKIAECLGVSESSVKRSTSALEKAGFIYKNRRFNKTNLVTVNKWTGQNDPSIRSNCPVQTGQTDPSIRSNCPVQTGQTDPSRQVKMTSYKNRDKNKDKISLEGEGQNQGLSRDDDLHSPNVRIVEDDTEQKLLTEDQESMPVVIEVTPLLSDDDDYFESDPDFDFIDDEETYLLEQRAEKRNQQIQDHFSVQKPTPTPDQYQRMLGGNRVSQFKSKQSKPAWM